MLLHQLYVLKDRVFPYLLQDPEWEKLLDAIVANIDTSVYANLRLDDFKDEFSIDLSKINGYNILPYSISGGEAYSTFTDNLSGGEAINNAHTLYAGNASFLFDTVVVYPEMPSATYKIASVNSYFVITDSQGNKKAVDTLYIKKGEPFTIRSRENVVRLNIVNSSSNGYYSTFKDLIGTKIFDIYSYYGLCAAANLLKLPYNSVNFEYETTVNNNKYVSNLSNDFIIVISSNLIYSSMPLIPFNNSDDHDEIVIGNNSHNVISYDKGIATVYPAINNFPAGTRLGRGGESVVMMVTRKYKQYDPVKILDNITSADSDFNEWIKRCIPLTKLSANLSYVLSLSKYIVHLTSTTSAITVNILGNDSWDLLLPSGYESYFSVNKTNGNAPDSIIITRNIATTEYWENNLTVRGNHGTFLTVTVAYVSVANSVTFEGFGTLDTQLPINANIAIVHIISDQSWTIKVDCPGNWAIVENGMVWHETGSNLTGSGTADINIYVAATKDGTARTASVEVKFANNDTFTQTIYQEANDNITISATALMGMHEDDNLFEVMASDNCAWKVDSMDIDISQFPEYGILFSKLYLTDDGSFIFNKDTKTLNIFNEGQNTEQGTFKHIVGMDDYLTSHQNFPSYTPKHDFIKVYGVASASYRISGASISFLKSREVYNMIGMNKRIQVTIKYGVIDDAFKSLYTKDRDVSSWNGFVKTYTFTLSFATMTFGGGHTEGASTSGTFGNGNPSGTFGGSK